MPDMMGHSRRGESGLAMIMLLVVWVASLLFVTGMINIIISEVLTAGNEANQIKAQNLAEAGLAFGWGAVESWSTWCDAASVGGEAGCPMCFPTSCVITGGAVVGNAAEAKVDQTASAIVGGGQAAVKVMVGVGATTFATTANPAQLATAEAVIRQTALVIPTSFAFGIFSNTSLTVAGPSAAMPTFATLNVPGPCIANMTGIAGGTSVTNICQTMGPLYASVNPNGTGNITVNVSQPILGAVYANNVTVGGAAPTSPITGCASATLCLLTAGGGGTSVSLTGAQPAIATGLGGSVTTGAGVLCNSGACSTANTTGNQYQFPMWNWTTMKNNSNAQHNASGQGVFYLTAAAFYTEACGHWFNAGTGVTTIPSGMYFIQDSLVVFDNDPSRCLGQVVLNGGSIAVYCSTALACGSNNPSGIGVNAASCSNNTPCGDIIFGGPASGTSTGCTVAHPCSFTLIEQKTYAAGLGISVDNDTPVIMVGGSVGGCGGSAGLTPCIITGVLAGNGAGGTAEILPVWSNSATPPCGTGTWSNQPALGPGIYIDGLVYALANTVNPSSNAPTYGWCLTADGSDTVALQGSLVAQSVYEFEGQLLWDPSIHYAGLNAQWESCAPNNPLCGSVLANGNPLKVGSVTIIPLSENSGQ